MQKRLYKIILSIFEWIVAIAAVIGIVGIIIPRIFQIVPYIVLSGSMEPEIQAGSIVYINQNIKIDEIEEQDIIGYCMNNGVRVVHRVIELDKKNHIAITKGDANRVKDLSPVSFEQIKGKSVISIPYAGYGIAWLRSATGKGCIIFFAVAFLTMTILKRA